jgi:hypothetical protein
LGRHRHRLVAGSVTAALVLALSVGPVSADSIGSTQARADQLAAQIAAGAAQIRLLNVRYFQATDRAAGTSAELARTKADLAHIQQHVDASRAVLRAQAVSAYVGGRSRSGTAGDWATGATGAVTDVVVRGEYLKLAFGDAADALDQLRANAQRLRTSEADVRKSQEAAQAAADQVMNARQAALAEARRQQAVFDQVTGQLDALVAAQQAALHQAQAAAARAQQAAAARVSQPPQGLPVNGGLVTTIIVVTSPKPPPAAPPSGPPAPGPPPAGGVWLALRQCESSDDYAANTGNGFFGAYQFSQSTWTGLGYPGRPDLEPPAMQDQAAQRLQAESGWGQWPVCAAALGLI